MNVSKKKKSCSVFCLILSCIAACSNENAAVEAPISEQTLIKTEKTPTTQQLITTVEEEKPTQHAQPKETSTSKNPLEQKVDQLLDELDKTREENTAPRKKVEELLKQSEEHRKFLQSQQ